MKTVLFVRHMFQLLVFFCICGIIGSIGAWEMGSVSFVQMLVQLLLFSGSGLFSASLSKRRFFLRLRRHPAPRRHSVSTRPSYAATRL